MLFAPEETYGPDVPRRYGTGLLGPAAADHRLLVVTMPEPWEHARRQFGRPPHALHLVTSMDEGQVEAEERGLPEVDRVFGIGGGSCMDFAKFVAWRRGLPLLLAPSVVSVDACLTESVAVRRQGRVHYVGEAYPREVLVDFDLICAAPPELNHAGAGDILSIHTALYDWRLAHRDRGEPFDPDVAEASRGLLDVLSEHADAIRKVTPEGVRALVELFWAEVVLCRKVQSSRPEEGSEHFWAYNLESRTCGHYIHGDLVALGIVLMSRLQDNDPAGIRDRIDALGLRRRPADLGISATDLRQSLLTARAYCESDGLAYSVLNARPITEREVDGLLAACA